MKLVGHLILFWTLTSIAVNGQVNSFVARSMGTKAELHWNAISIKVGEYFTIERSTDSKTWTEIGQLNSKENILVENKYSFTDKGPLDGKFYYRVKQITQGGQSVVSETKSVDSFSLINVFEVIPSETNRNTFIIHSDANTELTLTNEIGEIVKIILLSESNNYQYVLRDLNKGIYLLAGTNFKGTFRDKISVDIQN